MTSRTNVLKILFTHFFPKSPSSWLLCQSSLSLFLLPGHPSPVCDLHSSPAGQPPSLPPKQAFSPPQLDISRPGENCLPFVSICCLSTLSSKGSAAAGPELRGLLKGQLVSYSPISRHLHRLQVLTIINKVALHLHV